jgi:flagellar basal-body rod protein FlgC
MTRLSLISGATLSSLLAQARSLAVSAANVANLRSVDYQPQRVVQTSGPEGGVRAKTVPLTPPSVQVYDPNNPAADDDGLVSLPNVSLEEEFVVQLQAKLAYKANLAALEAQDEVLGELLDVES